MTPGWPWSSPASAISGTRMRLAILATLATLALDQATKLGVLFGLHLADRGEIDVLPPYLVFRMAWNKGINFGLFTAEAQFTRWLLIAIALGISAWVWIWVRRDGASRPAQIAAGLLIGGAVGNVIDRLRHREPLCLQHRRCGDLHRRAGAGGVLGQARLGRGRKTPKGRKTCPKDPVTRAN